MGCWGGRPWRLAIKPSVLKDYTIIPGILALFSSFFGLLFGCLFVFSLNLFVCGSLLHVLAAH